MIDQYQIINDMAATHSPAELLAWLSDGEALAAAGIDDQEAVEEAWYAAREMAEEQA